MIKRIALSLGVLCLVVFGSFIWFQKESYPDQLTTHIAIEIEPEQDSYMLGFQNIQSEINEQAILQGTFPEWLEGDLFFAGPGRFEINDTFTTNWSGGLAMIHRWSIKNGTVTYANKFIENEIAKKVIERGSMKEPRNKKSWLSGLATALFSDAPIYDNTNTNIMKIGNEFIAVSESAHTNSFDPCTLKTIGHTQYKDEVDCHYICAHPLFDKEKNEWINYGTTFGARCYYKLFTFKPDSKERKIITTIKVKNPAYMHSFCATKNYIILIESPFRVNPYDLLGANGSFIECFKWRPKDKTNFIIVDRNTHKVTTLNTKPFFFFHQVNAFEQNGAIVLDLVTYDDPSIITSYTLEKIFDPEHPFDDSRVTRFTLDLETKAISSSILQKTTTKVPTINKNCCMQPHRYIWASGTDDLYNYTNQLKKIDLLNKKEKIWQEKDCYTRDPIFVSKPNSSQEDEGIILSVVLDARKKQTFLLVLDAQTCEEIGRATITHPIPFTLHGKFFKKRNL